MIKYNYKKLKLRRQQIKKTQEEIAKESGITRAYISMLEGGKRKPRVITISKLSKALGVKPHFFFK